MKTKPFSVLEEALLSDPARAATAEIALQRARAEYEEYQASLAELRQAQELTDIQMAETLGVTPAEVVQIERQADLYLQALRDQVTALGGELELSCRFKSGTKVPVSFQAAQL
jgi:hypothetical protein